MDQSIAKLINQEEPPTAKEILARWSTGSGTDFEVLRAYSQLVRDTEFAQRWKSGLTPDPDRDELMRGLIAEHRSLMRPYVDQLMANGMSNEDAWDVMKRTYHSVEQELKDEGKL